MSSVSSGFVGPGEQRSFEVVLKVGTTSTIYVRPQSASADLDLHVYDEDGDLVAYDEHLDIDAACRFTPDRTGRFRIVVSSAQGSSGFDLLIKTVSDEPPI